MFNSVKKLFPVQIFFLLVIVQGMYAQEYPAQLPDTLLDRQFQNTSTISYCAYDLTDSIPLIGNAEKLLLHPASNQKIFTSSAALIFLGSDYNFETSVYHTGEIKDSVCFGDIFIKGGCDPGFKSSDLDSLVREIKNYGISEIRGNLYGDVSMSDSLYFGKGWMWDDDPQIYSPYLSPLSINRNGVQIIVTPSEPGQKAGISINQPSSYYEFNNRTLTVDSLASGLKISRDWINRKNSFIISGEINAGAKPDSTELNVYNPAGYFLTLMKESFKRHKIKFGGLIDTLGINENAEKIFSIERTVESVLPYMNKESDNLSAELLLRTLAYFRSGSRANAAKGVELVDSLITLTGRNPKLYRIADGSGLSLYNLSSTEQIVDLLKYMYAEHEDLFVVLYNSFPVSGIDGTLNERMQDFNLVRRIHAKTGSMSGINNLSGYLTTSKNHLIAFSIMVQNYAGSSSEAKNIQEKFCAYLIQNF